MIALNELYALRHAALIAFEVNAGKQIEALERRIATGEKMIDEEILGAHDVAKVDRARLRLAQLWDELQHLRLAYEVPTMIYESLYSLAEWTSKRHLPDGSHVIVHIPGAVAISLDLANANEAPF